MSALSTDSADRILDRYMSKASEKERQEAKDNLKRLARLLVRIEDRMAREWRTSQIRDSTEGAVDLDERSVANVTPQS
jgi:hypothetical protein